MQSRRRLCEGNRDSQPEFRPVGVVNIEVIRIPSRYSCFLTNHVDWRGGGSNQPRRKGDGD